VETGVCALPAESCGADEDNDLPGTAHPLAGPVSGSLCPGDLDWYRITVGVDEALVIESGVSIIVQSANGAYQESFAGTPAAAGRAHCDRRWRGGDDAARLPP
jgi:hypothetical protein